MKNFISKLKIVFYLAVLGLGILLPASFAVAQEPASVLFENNPLFGENDVKPGDSVQKWIRVTNNSGDDLKVSLSAENFISPILDDDLARALNIEIKKGTDVLYGPTLLSDFYSAGRIFLSIVPDGSTHQYDIAISFPLDKSNEWQAKTTSFDIKVIYEGNSENGVTGSVLGSMGGGGGAVINSGLYIFNERVASVGQDGVLITWQTNLFSSSRIIYSESDSIFDSSDSPNYGYANSNPEDSLQITTHSMTLSGLKPATTYYARCFSQDSSGHAISSKLIFTTGSVAGAYAEGQPGGGSSQEDSGTQNGAIIGSMGGQDQDGGSVEGTSTQECQNGNCQEEQDNSKTDNFLASVAVSRMSFCWINIVIIFILLVWYLWLIIKRKNDKTKQVLPVVVALMLVFYAWKCCPTCGLTCCYWFWALLVADIVLFISSLLLRKK